LINEPFGCVSGGLRVSQSLVRNVLRIIDAIGVYLVGFLIAIFSRLKQRLGDHVAKTVVVQKDSGPMLRAVPRQNLVHSQNE
jgi:uncharacterized RDD family membrane protein YckC